MIFIDVRDRWGVTQIVIEENSELKEMASGIRREYVIKVSGKVCERKSKNIDMPTGEIEIVAESLEILSAAKTTPMIIADETDALEEIRMRHRYLDIRRNPVREKLITRHKIITAMRDVLNSNEFIEVETPILGKATPEGARDYLVPSRVNQGKFYALPQSPQMFKQLLMIGGLERYYQIAKCFRDEDLRADRQPEFTQLDVETSFMSATEIQDLCEKIMVKAVKDSVGVDVETPFIRMTYNDAMNLYGSDKPDTRFDLLIQDFTDVAKETEFNVFNSAETVKALVVNEELGRKVIDELESVAKEHGAKGLA